MDSKQLKKQLYLSILLALLTISILAVATFSWLALNREVNASGMQIQAETTANLVISNNQRDWDNTTTVSTVARSLLPAMHKDGSASGLQRVNDSVIIKQDTGLPADIGTLAYTDVAIEATSPYYIDYTVYIAADGKELPASLTATITAPTGDTVAYHQAASIDFYVNGTYADSLNLAGLALSNDSTYSDTAVKTETSALANTIPCSDTGYITVLMRCYFDGALHNSENTTYVTTNNLETTGFNLGILFTATETSTQ